MKHFDDEKNRFPQLTNEIRFQIKIVHQFNRTKSLHIEMENGGFSRGKSGHFVQFIGVPASIKCCLFGPQAE